MAASIADMVALSGASRYDKFKNWGNVQDDILEILRTVDRKSVNIAIPSNVQVSQILRQANHLNCRTLVRGMQSNMYVTQCSSGSANQLQAWNITHSDHQLKTSKITVIPKITSLLFVARHRVFVGYCSDMTLRVFSDVVHGFVELSSTPCQNTILSMVYNRDNDELITGGAGCLNRWRFSEYREKLTEIEPFDISVDKETWVTEVKIDHRNKQMLVQTEEAIYILNYKTNSMLHFFPNRHGGTLSCNATYKPFDYFITASVDGSIKVWNSILFTLMHEFVGHFNAVTGMAVHPTEPLLITCSLDGTIRMWRLDTFEVYQRLDMGEAIEGMWLVNSQELAYKTQKQIHICKLNLIVSLFCPIQSTVYHLQRCRCANLPAKILVSAEDGGVRFVSPVTGAITTIIYPMASFRVLLDLVYDQRENQVYSVMNKGEVMVFNCDTNPCQPAHRLLPNRHDTNIICITLLYFGHRWNMEERDVGESLIFAGHKDGTISLMQSTSHTLKHNVQGHQGQVTVLQTSYGVPGDKCCPPVAKKDLIVSGGTDNRVKVWSVEQSQAEGHSDDEITLTHVCTIECEGEPSFIQMFGNSVAVSVKGKGNVWIYRIKDHTGDGQLKITPLKHQYEDNHSHQVNGLDCSPFLKLYVSTGDDGLVKLWDTEGQLVREIVLDESLHSVCFANERGDLLLGYHSHVYAMAISRYLPPDYLERMILTDFKDDQKEQPLTFNHSLQLWFDYKRVKQYPADNTVRRELLSEQHNQEQIQQKRNANVRAKDNLQAITESILEERRELEFRRTSTKSPLPSIRRKSDVSPQQKSAQSQTGSPLSKEDLGIIEEEADSGGVLGGAPSTQDEGGTPPAQPDPTSDSQEDKENAEKNSNTDTKDGEKKGEKKNTNKGPKKPQPPAKKFLPIAPDGYIPNSCVRKVLGFKPKDDLFSKREDTWKLKPAPDQDASLRAKQSSSDENAKGVMSDASVVTNPMIFEDEKAEVVAELPLDDGANTLAADEPATSTASTPRKARDPGAIKKRLRESRKQLGTSEFDPWSKSKKKGKRVSIKEEDEDDVDAHWLLKKIGAEQWFPRSSKKTIPGVVSAFVAIMDTVNPVVHTQICDYILEIKKEIGYPEEQLDRLIKKLIWQLESKDDVVRENAVRTLGDLGVRRDDIILGVMPKLIDENRGVRKEAVSTVYKLTGVADKDQLANMLTDMGAFEQFSSKKIEEAVLGVLSENLPHVATRDEMENKISAWMTESGKQGPPANDELLKDMGLNEEEESTTKTKPKRRRKPRQGKVKSSRGSQGIPGMKGQTKQTSPPTNRKAGGGPSDGQDGVDSGTKQSWAAPRGGDTTPRSQKKLLPDNQALYNMYNRRDDDTASPKLPAVSVVDRTSEHLGGDIQTREYDTGLGTDLESDLVSTAGSGMTGVDSGFGPYTSDDAASSYSKPGVSRAPHLSPIKASMMEQPPENWREFFERPSAQERRMREEGGRDWEDKTAGLPPIRYITDDAEMMQAEPGVRVLHTVNVMPKSDDSESAKRHRVGVVPGKLGIHTSQEDSGSSKFGILDMQWTTASPITDLSARRKGGATSPPGGSTHLPMIGESRSRSMEMLSEDMVGSDRFLPHLNRARSGPTYEWEEPLPPPPPRESRLSLLSQPRRRAHNHHCDYYRFLRKGMHQHVPPSSPQQSSHDLIRRMYKIVTKSHQGSTHKSPRGGATYLPPITLHTVLTTRS